MHQEVNKVFTLDVVLRGLLLFSLGLIFVEGLLNDLIHVLKCLGDEVACLCVVLKPPHSQKGNEIGLDHVVQLPGGDVPGLASLVVGVVVANRQGLLNYDDCATVILEVSEVEIG